MTAAATAIATKFRLTAPCAISTVLLTQLNGENTHNHAKIETSDPAPYHLGSSNTATICPAVADTAMARGTMIVSSAQITGSATPTSLVP